MGQGDSIVGMTLIKKPPEIEASPLASIGHIATRICHVSSYCNSLQAKGGTSLSHMMPHKQEEKTKLLKTVQIRRGQSRVPGL